MLCCDLVCVFARSLRAVINPKAHLCCACADMTKSMSHNAMLAVVTCMLVALPSLASACNVGTTHYMKDGVCIQCDTIVKGAGDITCTKAGDSKVSACKDGFWKKSEATKADLCEACSTVAHAKADASKTCTKADDSKVSACALGFTKKAEATKADVCQCPAGQSCAVDGVAEDCKAATASELGQDTCGACAADTYSLPKQSVCVAHTELRYRGTCDKSNPSFFEEFRTTFQSTFATKFAITPARLFLFEIECPDGSLRRYPDATGAATVLKSALPGLRRQLAIGPGGGIAARFIVSDAGKGAETASADISTALQTDEDAGKLGALLNFKVDGFNMAPQAYLGVNKLLRESTGTYCLFCKGHKKMLDDLLAKTFNAAKFKFSVVIEPTAGKPLGLEIFMPAKK